LQTEDRAAPETQWVRVTAWEELALELAEKLHKGAAVYVEGRLRLDRWPGPDGAERSGLSVSAWTVVPMGVGRKSAKGLARALPFGPGAFDAVTFGPPLPTDTSEPTESARRGCARPPSGPPRAAYARQPLLLRPPRPGRLARPARGAARGASPRIPSCRRGR